MAIIPNSLTNLGDPMEAAGAAKAVRPAEVFWNLPNSITMLRIGVVPVLLAIPFATSKAACQLIAWCFILAAVSDVVDGHLARRGGQVTRIGKLLDPLAGVGCAVAGAPGAGVPAPIGGGNGDAVGAMVGDVGGDGGGDGGGDEGGDGGGDAGGEDGGVDISPSRGNPLYASMRYISTSA